MTQTHLETTLKSTLETAMEGVRSIWGPLSTALALGATRRLAELASAPKDEPWLQALHDEAPANCELYRDPDHGFVLMAHTEHAGLYRPPHDHGRAWVVYAVEEGEIEIGTYIRQEAADGSVSLVKRDALPLRAGEARAFLPGDIHDTRCVSGRALLFRFTERDLKKEDKEEHRLVRYVEKDGGWTAPAR